MCCCRCKLELEKESLYGMMFAEIHVADSTQLSICEKRGSFSSYFGLKLS